METIDRNIYTGHDLERLLLNIVFVEDIIVGSNVDKLSKQFQNGMHMEFEMSMLGEMFSFLGLHVQQKDKNIFRYPTKYLRECNFHTKRHG